MSLISTTHQDRSSKSSTPRNRRRTRRGNTLREARHVRRLRLETLEQRLLLSQFRCISPGGGRWDNPDIWGVYYGDRGDGVPGGNDEVHIGVREFAAGQLDEVYVKTGFPGAADSVFISWNSMGSPSQGELTIQSGTSLQANWIGVGGTHNGTLNVSGSLVVGELVLSGFAGPAATANLLPGGTLNVGSIYGLDGTEVFNFSGGTIRNLSGQDSTINNTIGLIHILGTASHDFYADASGSINLKAHMDGSGPIHKRGPGTLNVYSSGNNGFTGSTSIDSGTLRLAGTGGSLSNYTDLTVNANTTFDLNGISDTIDGLAGAGSVTLGGGTLTVGYDGGTRTFSGVISEAGNLIKRGSGTFTLGGINTYGGTTTVNGGTLSLSASERLPNTTDLTVNSAATFDLNGKSETIDGLAGVGSVTLGGGTLTVGANSDSSTFSGVISEAGNLVKSGAGTLVLSNSNTYGGTTTVLGGKLSLFGSDRLSDATDLAINTGAYFDLAGYSEVIDGLSGAGSVILGNGTLTVGGNSGPGATSTFAGVISGETGSLVKSGLGNLVLGGGNTYGGTTSVSAGTLQVDGSIASPLPLTVYDGATLSGTGSVTAVNVLAGGTISPGPGRQVLDTGNLVLVAGSTFEVELNGTVPGSGHDQLKVTGTVDLGDAILSPSLGFAATGNETFLIIDNDSSDAVTGTFAGLPELSPVILGGRVFRITYHHNGNSVALVPNRWPVANAGFDRIADEGSALTFDGSTSWDRDEDA